MLTVTKVAVDHAAPTTAPVFPAPFPQVQPDDVVWIDPAKGQAFRTYGWRELTQPVPLEVIGVKLVVHGVFGPLLMITGKVLKKSGAYLMTPAGTPKTRTVFAAAAAIAVRRSLIAYDQVRIVATGERARVVELVRDADERRVEVEPVDGSGARRVLDERQVRPIELAPDDAPVSRDAAFLEIRPRDYLWVEGDGTACNLHGWPIPDPFTVCVRRAVAVTNALGTFLYVEGTEVAGDGSPVVDREGQPVCRKAYLTIDAFVAYRRGLKQDDLVTDAAGRECIVTGTFEKDGAHMCWTADVETGEAHRQPVRELSLRFSEPEFEDREFDPWLGPGDRAWVEIGWGAAGEQAPENDVSGCTVEITHLVPFSHQGKLWLHLVGHVVDGRSGGAPIETLRERARFGINAPAYAVHGSELGPLS